MKLAIIIYPAPPTLHISGDWSIWAETVNEISQKLIYHQKDNTNIICEVTEYKEFKLMSSLLKQLNYEVITSEWE